jgi:hypothetical protein
LRGAAKARVAVILIGRTNNEYARMNIEGSFNDRSLFVGGK